jgi:D-alanine-D-alanine ligase
VRRVRVGVLFGGRSGEHEVSLASAASVLSALDPHRFEAVPIGIARDGSWHPGATPELLLNDPPPTPQLASDPPTATQTAISRMSTSGPLTLNEDGIDVVFPVLHGPYGEDGKVQGLLAMADIPYVGSQVLGSALGMDKWRMKAMFAQWGLPNVPYVGFRSVDWTRRRNETIESLESRLAYPMFVKPSNMGSSVGISRANDRTDLVNGVNIALNYDTTVVVEQSVVGREVECGVLGNDDPLVSVPGEIVPRHAFYDYEAKYTEGLADLVIPAHLTPDQTSAVQDMAKRAFLAVDAAGLARVDFFVLKKSGEVLVNEINTMPGFTATSMYPKLWEATGLAYRDLITRLIELAIERFESNACLRNSR